MSTEIDGNALVHLWEARHPYYCNEGNFLANGYYTRHESWADFHECMGDSDPELNLLFRWDWKRYAAGDDGEPASEAFQAFFIGQRKGLFFSHECQVSAADEPAIRAWLLTRMPHLLALWAPLINKGSAPIPGPEGKAGSLTYPGLAASAETTGADVLSIGPGGSSSEVDDG